LNILARGKKWKMATRDREKLVLIGADSFSCGWAQKNVAVNYRSTGESEGELVSLELQ